MIKLNNDWYIEADNCCYSLRKKYTLEEKEKKLEACKDKDKTIDDYENDFEIYGYYSTMESAINGYIKKCMRDKVAKCQISDISAFLTELKDIKKEISILISPISEDISKDSGKTKSSKKK